MSDITRNAVQTQEHWADDNAVANCQDDECPLAAPGSAAGVAFSRTLRKHHCRFCGGIFCWKCAADYITLSTSKGKKPFRACKGCVLEYKAIQSLKPLGGDKGVFRQWHQKFITALYAIDEDFGDMVKCIELSRHRHQTGRHGRNA